MYLEIKFFGRWVAYVLWGVKFILDHGYGIKFTGSKHLKNTHKCVNSLSYLFCGATAGMFE